MSHYKHVPFTSNLQMWSPSSSLISLDFNLTAYPYATAASTQTAAPNHYHHEPLFYPAACIICGLFHHPVPHTMMNSATEQYPSSTAVATATTNTITIITPAPSSSSLPTIPLERRRRKKHGKITRKMKNRLLTCIQSIYFRLMSTFTTPFRKRHNIYPLKRHAE